MSKSINAADGAALLGVTTRRFRTLCSERRIVGARFIGRSWFVPENFVVTEGARGPALTNAAARVIRRVENSIASLHVIEHDYGKLAKKHELKRYPHGELPIAIPFSKPKKNPGGEPRP